MLAQVVLLCARMLGKVSITEISILILLCAVIEHDGAPHLVVLILFFGLYLVFTIINMLDELLRTTRPDPPLSEPWWKQKLEQYGLRVKHH